MGGTHVFPIKLLKGRMREAWLRAHRAGRAARETEATEALAAVEAAS